MDGWSQDWNGNDGVILKTMDNIQKLQYGVLGWKI